jgi:hypothetical protein
MLSKKSFFLVSLIVLITSICGTTMAATQAQIENAIEKGVAWLATQQNSSTGYWQDSSRVAPTAFAVVKLEERAFELGKTPFDPSYLYKENVEKGLAYLFSQMSIISISTQPAGNPDSDGDGNGVFMNTSQPTYETGIAMMAIAASRAPNRVVNVLGSPVNGWTYKKVLQNMVDYMAFGQYDSGAARGGWRYTPNSGADNSCSGYAVLGLGYAEAWYYGFNCTIPPFVKDELKIWIDYIQTEGGSDDGGSGYSSPNYMVNILKTGNLVFQITFAEMVPQNQNIQRALAYIGRKWNDSSQSPGWGNPAYGGTPHCQTMFCAMKGLEYAGIDTIVVNGSLRDWYADFADAIVNRQQTSGNWPAESYGGTVLATEWALLTLEKSAPVRIPFLEKHDNIGDSNCVGPGSEITYTIYYNWPNDPNLPNLNDVNIIDYLPVKVEFVSASNGGSYDSNSHTVRWPIGTVPPGDVNCFTLKVDVKCPQPGSTITNCCEIKSGDQTLNTAYENTPVCPGPTLTKVDNITGCVGPGDNITYSICYTAHGYGDTNVVITDNLPNQVDYVSSDHGGNYNPVNRTVTWNIGTLGPNESSCVTLTVKVKCAQPGSTITNHCEMSGDCISPIYAYENTSVCSWYPTLTKVDIYHWLFWPRRQYNLQHLLCCSRLWRYECRD